MLPAFLVILLLAICSLEANSASVFSSVASKFKQLTNVDSTLANLMATPITTGVFQGISYTNTATCNNEANAIEYMYLGSCNIYTTNATDPYAVPTQCGGYMSPSATQMGTTLYLTYNFYKDSKCTVLGNATNPKCTTTAQMSTVCTSTPFGKNNYTSSFIGMITPTLTLPANGYQSE